MDRDTLERLSKDDLITLVLAQAAQIAIVTERVAALEAKLGLPPKTEPRRVSRRLLILRE